MFLLKAYASIRHHFHFKISVTQLRTVASMDGYEEMDRFIVSMKTKLRPCTFGLKAFA